MNEAETRAELIDPKLKQNGWDGKIGGLLQSTGVYVWMFQGIGWDKKMHTQKGTIALIR